MVILNKPNISSFNDNDKMIMIRGYNDVLEKMIEILNLFTDDDHK